MRGKTHATGALRLLPVFLLAAAVALSAASCGGSASKSSTSAQSSTKLPPGTTASQEASTSAGQSAESQSSQDLAQQPAMSQSTTTTQSTTTQSTTTPMAGADLGAARFTVVSATRPSTNEMVTSSSERKVSGDYLQVELTVENVGDELANLSNYSFRLYSPGITASQYEDYYGTTATYGAYVSKHVVSATLLDISTLKAVSYKLKMGEKLEDVFLFYDLNPLSTAANASVTKDNTALVVYDTESGEDVEISLAGYPDK
jgi:hypothetical protein